MSVRFSRPLIRLTLFIGSLMLMTLIACQSILPEGEPTPVPTIKSPSLVPQEVPITTLLRNPNSFEGQTIWITGQYRSLPLLVCRETTHRLPATWTLVFGDVATYVSGFDEALRPLADTGLSLTVEGRWQKWSGPVGCGRRAPTEEIWYLAAAKIISPNPLVKSDEEGDVVVALPTPTAEVPTPEGLPIVTPTSSPTEETGEGEPSPTRTPSPTFQSIPSPTVTPRPSSTTPTNGGDDNTSTPSATPSTTATLSGTAEPGTGTPTTTATATTAGGTPGATAEPADQGELVEDTVEKHNLAANSPHSWTLNPPAEDPIILTAGSVLGLNLKLTLIAPNGTVVAEANQGGAGGAEVINFTTPNPTGEFTLIVSGEGGTSGDYVLLFFDSTSTPVVVIRDTVTYGSSGSGSNPANIDHFWNFVGQAGDVISIEVSPTNSSGDLYLYLIGPDGEEILAVNETGVGGNESLFDYTLTASGFFSIGIGEYNYEPVAYSLTLTQ